jgi:hypothetical protein
MTLVIPRGPNPDALVADRRSQVGWMTTSRPGGATRWGSLINQPGWDCSRSPQPAKLLAETHALPDKTLEEQRGVLTRSRGIAGYRRNRPLRHSATLKASDTSVGSTIKGGFPSSVDVERLWPIRN